MLEHFQTHRDVWLIFCKSLLHARHCKANFDRNCWWISLTVVPVPCALNSVFFLCQVLGWKVQPMFTISTNQYLPSTIWHIRLKALICFKIDALSFLSKWKLGNLVSMYFLVVPFWHLSVQKFIYYYNFKGRNIVSLHTHTVRHKITFKGAGAVT